MLYLAIITNLTLFMTYSITYNENINRNVRPISTYEISTEVKVKSSYDKYLEKVEEATGETKFIYYVTNENSAVGNQGVLYNKDYFLTSINFIFDH